MPTVAPKYRSSKEFLLVYMELIVAARHRGTVTYQEIAQIMGLPLSGNHMSREVGYILGEITDNEVSYGRPMLSALAIGVSGQPGSGFFALAKELDKFHDEAEEAKQRFWQQERQAVYEVWKKDLKRTS